MDEKPSSLAWPQATRVTGYARPMMARSFLTGSSLRLGA